MAKITAGIGCSHIPVPGFARDDRRTEEAAFDGFDWTRNRMREETKPNVVIVAYNNHASTF